MVGAFADAFGAPEWLVGASAVCASKLTATGLVQDRTEQKNERTGTVENRINKANCRTS